MTDNGPHGSARLRKSPLNAAQPALTRYWKAAKLLAVTRPAVAKTLDRYPRPVHGYRLMRWPVSPDRLPAPLA
ncbi:Uncharacterised protein [Vibrio cholerae]|uniref:Z29r protein n=1 Tax=Vibrio cholerae TaxID=666 RepID=O87036_VIBCL|nr:z29r [Vibrio cholerae]CSB72566.1 Uncharacterised protein [Vibrio cholerae]